MRLTLALAVWLGVSGAEAAPKFDLNTAGVQTLEALPGIGLATARRIVRIRERNGPFRCVEELRAAPRLSEGQYRTLESRLEVRDGDDCKRLDARRSGQPARP